MIDATNPKDPERTVTIQTHEAHGVAIRPDGSSALLYVADGVGGVGVFRARGAGLERIGGLDIAGEACCLATDGEYLYIADAETGLRIADLSEPESPREIAALETGGAVRIDVRGEFAYLVTGDGSVVIVRITSPRFPVLYERVPFGAATSLAVMREHVYVGTGTALQVLKNYERGVSYQVSSLASEGKAYRITIGPDVDGSRYAAVADHAGGVHIIDVTDPYAVSGAAIIESIPTEYARDVAFTERYAYVADGPAGLKIIDLSPVWDGDPDTRAEIVAEWETGGNARGVEYHNGHVYLADGNRGIKVFDISDPRRPVQVASVQTEYAVDLAAGDSLLLVADGDGGTVIFDIADISPVRIARLPSGNTRCVTVEDSKTYVVGSLGLQIYDLGNPADPSLLGAYDTGYGERVSVSGRYAYIAEGIRGMSILDVGDPTSPYVVSEFENRFAVDVQVMGEYALVADTIGIKVVNVVIPRWALRE